MKTERKLLTIVIFVMAIGAQAIAADLYLTINNEPIDSTDLVPGQSCTIEVLYR